MNKKIYKYIKKILKNNRKPLTKENHIGIEIECICILNRAAIAHEFAKRKLDKYVSVGYDSSIQEYEFRSLVDGNYGHEIRICAPESIIHSIVNDVCLFLNEWGAIVNKTCGLHVHLDMRNRNKDIVFNNLVLTQPILFNMNPNYRKTNEFSKVVDVKIANYFDKKRKREKVSRCGMPECDCSGFDFVQNLEEETFEYTGHYNAININRIKDLKTFEIRMHAGTIDSVKINNWVDLLVLIASLPNKLEKEIKKISDFKKYIQLDNELESYVKERINKFKKRPNLIEYT